MTDLSPIVPKLAPLIRLLASDKSGEVAAAAGAIARVLKSVNADFHDLASACAGPTKEDLMKIYRAGFDAGRAEGVRVTEEITHGSEEFASVGEPSFNEMAGYCQRRINKLAPKHHEFIDKMSSMTLYREPSPKQAKYLKSLFAQCGGGR